MSTSEQYEKQQALDDIFRKEWGEDFEASAKAINQMTKEFEKRIKHAGCGPILTRS